MRNDMWRPQLCWQCYCCSIVKHACCCYRWCCSRCMSKGSEDAVLHVVGQPLRNGVKATNCLCAGEDVIYVFNCGGNSRSATALTAATLKSSSCHPPNCEFTEICDSALASAKDKLYMLGGEILCGASEAATPLRIYEPRIDSW